MKIRDESYKGYRYTINFVAEKKDWPAECLNTFSISSNCGFFSGHHNTLQKAVAEVQDQIDSFLSAMPSTEAAWVQLISECVTSDGYEEWHVDKTKALHVLELYKRK